MSPHYAKAYMQERLNEAQRMRETRLARHTGRARRERRGFGRTLGQGLPIVRGRLSHNTCEQTPLEAA